MLSVFLLAIVLNTVGTQNMQVSLESETRVVDPARSLFLTLSVVGEKATQLPDLRERAVGFSLAEDFEEPPVTLPNGQVKQVANWRLVPEPVAKVYKLKPFAIGGAVFPATYFESPAAREAVTGEFECDPKKVMPPISFKLIGWVLGFIALTLAIGYGLFVLIRFLLRKLKEHRMSPIERAWVELDRLIKKGLPGRGRYKDFYVELTLVVRRYIQRKYGIKAPNLTTEEFLREAHPSDELRAFLTSADLIKFAGVEATPEMADEATDSARNYLKGDSAQ